MRKNAFTRGEPEHGAELADELERIVALHDASTIAAVIVEPVAGSTGVLMPPKGYLKRLREICTKHGILLIFDEVITGFGRLGTPFAADYFGVTPDIMTIAKGLTNGVIPMGAVFVTKEIHDAFMTGPEHIIEFFHGYTYSGHPIACAAALGTLDTYKEEGLLTRGAELAPYWEDALHSLKGEPNVIDIRNIGLVGAIELAPIARRARRKRAFDGLPQGVRARRADPHHRRHHRAVAAADHHQGPDRRADRSCPRSQGVADLRAAGTSRRSGGRRRCAYALGFRRARDGWHARMDYVVTTLTPCVSAGGAGRRQPFDMEAVGYRREGVEHNVVNGGTSRWRSSK